MRASPRDPRTPERRGPERISVLTRALLEAQETGGFVEPPSVTRPFTLDDAYRIGAEAARHRLRQGWSFGGWKVGFTNREIWSRWGLDRPIVAPVYRETIFHAARRAPAHVALGTRAAPRIEVEVVFGFGRASEEQATGPARTSTAVPLPESPVTGSLSAPNWWTVTTRDGGCTPRTRSPTSACTRAWWSALPSR